MSKMSSSPVDFVIAFGELIYKMFIKYFDEKAGVSEYIKRFC